jgi:basic membrane protein A and related proteins
VLPRPLATRVLVVSACLASVACHGGREGGTRATTPSFRAALLTAGPVSDAGWYAGAYQGLLMVRDSMGAQVSNQQTRTPAEFDEAFLSYASSGYDLIFAHGFEYQDAALRAAAKFPGVTIVVSGGGKVAANVVPLIFTLEEGSYLAGMVAAGVTRTGVLGMVGGVSIPPVQGTFKAFRAGARAVRPDVQVLESYIGNWDDVAAAKEAAIAQIRRGADVLIHNTDAASYGVFQAVRDAVAAGDTTWAMGMNSDQNAVAPDVILGSAVIHIPEAFLQVARAWKAGRLGGHAVYARADSGAIDFLVNPALAGRIPADVLRRMGQARDSIRAGTLVVPRVPFVEGESGAGGTTGAP